MTRIDESRSDGVDAEERRAKGNNACLFADKIIVLEQSKIKSQIQADKGLITKIYSRSE